MIYPLGAFIYWLAVLTALGVICIYIIHRPRR